MRRIKKPHRPKKPASSPLPRTPVGLRESRSAFLHRERYFRYNAWACLDARSRIGIFSPPWLNG